MKLVPLLLKAFLLLGLCFSTRLEAQEKSKSEEKKSSAAKTVSKKQLQVWINQLSEGTFRERRTASNNLSKAGKQALPALVQGAKRNDPELSGRCVEIIIKMYRGKNETLYFAVRKALSELEKSSNSSVARRAKNAKQNFQEYAIDAIKKIGGKVTLDSRDNVKIVILSGPKVTDADLVHLNVMNYLQILDLADTKVTAAGLVHLKGLTKLQRLSLVNTKVTDAGLVHLKGLTSLESLWLYKTQVSGSGLVHLKAMKSLQDLDLDHTKVTDAGLEHLKGLTSLESLWLNNTKVTDAGLVHLKGLTNLESLWLNKTQVTGAGLIHLKGLTKLRELRLCSTKITDAGLVHLKGLTSLRELYLDSTRIRNAVVHDLEAALPKCKISSSSPPVTAPRIKKQAIETRSSASKIKSPSAASQ